AVVSEVGSAATSANAFPVKARIDDADEYVRPGMTTELTLLFSLEGQGEAGYIVPVQALVPGIKKDDGHVFVFDSATSTVRKTAVQGEVIVGNQAIITNGIASGDIVVVAGVPFLRDNQQVKLLNPSHAGQ
ncbi:MAG: efflux RND transporter periplasmic adaptor subunit, partial [Gammaproteobacteria bacterium]|nr:efflux RND transporter periplasmic adaptor subunit [Gammaproteobacteria bacterium]